ncbi:MAG TPA: hypothetical protein VJP07_00030 [Dehalococcoidia bacterium]|nr:hypothetical protein [Dehalococcoidia bacterium]
MRKHKQAPKLIRQGDVLLIPCGSIPAVAVPVPRDAGRVVLAYGEVTGHAHALLEPGVELLTAADVRYLRVDEVSAHLLHEEHSELAIPAGTYEVRIQREYSPLETRQVRD